MNHVKKIVSYIIQILTRNQFINNHDYNKYAENTYISHKFMNYIY